MPIDQRRCRAISRILLVASVLVAASGVVRVGGVSRAELQLILAPLVILAFSRISIGQVRVPNLVVLGALAGVLCGAVLGSVRATFREDRLLLTPFSDDRLGSDAHVMRDQMQRLLPPEEGSLLVVDTRKVDSVAAAERILGHDPQATGVVWGTKRWTQVSLRSHPARSVRELLGEQVVRVAPKRLQKLGDLKVIQGVPLVGLSGVEGYETHVFIGGLGVAWRDFPLALSGQSADVPFEGRIRSLAELQAHWTSSAHRALPTWMLGTYHAVRGISGVYRSEYETGEFLCAKAALQRALSYLRPGDNPELEAAILNNVGVAHFFEAELSAQPKRGRLIAVRYIEQAAAVLAARPHDGDASEEAKAIGENLALLDRPVRKRR